MPTRSDSTNSKDSVNNSSNLPAAFLVDIARLEAQAALDALAGEVGHEIGHTFTFLRCLIEEASDEATLGAEDVALARKEMERLKRVLNYLRKLKLPPPACVPVQLFDILRRVQIDVARLLAERDVALALGIAGGQTLWTDPGRLYLLLREMVSDGIRRTASSSLVEVHAMWPHDSGGGVIEVWNRAGRMHPQPDDEPFAPGPARMTGSSVLGLPIAFRIARSLGWELKAVREAQREGLRVTLPVSALHGENLP